MKGPFCNTATPYLHGLTEMRSSALTARLCIGRAFANESARVADYVAKATGAPVDEVDDIIFNGGDIEAFLSRYIDTEAAP